MDQDLRRIQTEFAAQFNLSLEEYLKVVQSCTAQEVVILLELMKTKNPRTGYRRLCQDQVRRWLAATWRGKPLTESQFKNLIPLYPVNWSLPK